MFVRKVNKVGENRVMLRVDAMAVRYDCVQSSYEFVHEISELPRATHSDFS